MWKASTASLLAPVFCECQCPGLGSSVWNTLLTFQARPDVIAASTTPLGLLTCTKRKRSDGGSKGCSAKDFAGAFG
ncbi:hypothetical protein ARTHRO9V_90055 [Arthrobacter sp. 9V]|nr:hypothetical protein ARTHRO9V_90055 [Arthrobacter sp. 9V]